MLASANPLDVVVLPGVSTQATFHFLLGGDDGSVRVDFGVAERVSRLSGRFFVTDDQHLSGGEPANPALNMFQGLAGRWVEVQVRFALAGTETLDLPPDGRRVRRFHSSVTHVALYADDTHSALDDIGAHQLTGGSLTIDLTEQRDGRFTLEAVLGYRNDDDPTRVQELTMRLGPVTVDALRAGDGYPAISTVGQSVALPNVTITTFDQGQTTPETGRLVGGLGQIFEQLAL